MSIHLTNLVWDSWVFPTLDHSQQVYLLHLVRTANDYKDLLCNVSIPYSNRKTRISEKQIKRNIKFLKELGVIRVENNGKSNYYYFDEELLACQTEAEFYELLNSKKEKLSTAEGSADNHYQKEGVTVSNNEKLSTETQKELDMVSNDLDMVSKKGDKMTPYNNIHNVIYKNINIAKPKSEEEKKMAVDRKEKEVEATTATEEVTNLQMKENVTGEIAEMTGVQPPKVEYKPPSSIQASADALESIRRVKVKPTVPPGYWLQKGLDALHKRDAESSVLHGTNAGE